MNSGARGWKRSSASSQSSRCARCRCGRIIFAGRAAHLRLIAVTDETGAWAGAVPLHPWPYKLRFTLKGKSLWEKACAAEWLLGSVPAMPADAKMHDALFESIHQSPNGADGLFLESVPTDSFLWRYLQSSPQYSEALDHLSAERTDAAARDRTAGFL